MGDICELSYCELRAKEIINTADGRRLGRISDIVFSGGNGEVRGIVVPYTKRFFFSRNQEIFIPWNCINKIGDDVILVNIISDGFAPGRGRGKRDFGYFAPPPPPPPPQDCCEPCGSKCEPPPYNAPPYFNDPHFDCGCSPAENDCECDKDRPDCDGKCEKCMLFDCAYRWKKC